MSRLRKPFPILVLLFSLIACSQPPVANPEATISASAATFTPYVAGTEEARASPTPWVAGTETALAFLSPTPTAVPSFTLVADASPTFTPFALSDGMFSPILYGTGPFLLIGGIKRDQGWLSGGQAAQFMIHELSYDLISPTRLLQVPSSPLEFDPICANHFMPSQMTLPEPMVGVASDWISERRGSRELSVDDPAYIQAVSEWFQSQGNSPAEIQITRILQADIEGDGVDEVLLSASYFKEKLSLLTETGDYSVVLMRKVIENEVVTIPLVKDYYVSSSPQYEVSYPNTYTLVNAIDLNRDGTLEVVVDVRRWEGWGALVFRVDGQNVREVLRTICPAT